MVVDAGKVKPPGTVEANVKRTGAKPWLKRQKGKRSFQFLMDSVRCGGAIQ